MLGLIPSKSHAPGATQISAGVGPLSPQATAKRADAATVAGVVAILGLIAGSLLIAVAAARGPSILSPPLSHDTNGWLTGPFHGIWPGRFSREATLQPPLAVVLGAMLVCYGLALACARHIGRRTAWGAIVVLHVIFFLGPPLLLTDVFNYSAYARMGVLHHLNPYVHLPVEIRHDFVYRISNWHHLRDPYGPLFTLFSYALVPLGLVKSYWAYKLATMAASLGALALVGRCARLLGRPPVPAVLLVGLNPIVLVYGLGGQHNDVFMLLPLFAALAYVLEGHDRRGGALATVAVFVKAPAALILPVIVLGCRRTGRAVVGALAAGAVCAAVSLAAFGAHLPYIDAQSNLQTEWSVPNALGLALGLGGANDQLRLVLQLVLVAGAAACWVWAWRSKRVVEPAACVVMIMLATVGWDVPWYVLWLLPFLAFAPPRRVARPALVLVAWITLQFLPTLPGLLDRGLKVDPWKTQVGKETREEFHRLVN
jgi:Glycosyltransferase family 87